MAQREEKRLQFNIEDGPTFFADEVSITNNEHKFFLDFKNSSPRIDIRANEALPISVKHSVMMMDPALAKVFAKLLDEHVKRFEKEHGKIPEPKINSEPIKPFVSKTDERPGYFG